MPEWILVSTIAIAFIGGFVFIAWVLSNLLGDIFEMGSISQFSNDFKDTVKHSQPTWDDIKEIASTRHLTQSQIHFTIRKYYREIMAGRDSELEAHKTLIKSYIDQYRKDEPFEGLPNEVRIHLERLRDQINGNDHLLEPLTSQIKDLLTVNATEKRNQKYFTVGGFFVGLAGFAFAVYTYYSTSNMDTLGSTKQTEAPETVVNMKDISNAE